MQLKVSALQMLNIHDSGVSEIFIGYLKRWLQQTLLKFIRLTFHSFLEAWGSVWNDNRYFVNTLTRPSLKNQ